MPAKIDDKTKLIAFEVYGLLEAYLCKVIIPSSGHEFIAIPQLYGIQKGSSIMADLVGLDRQHNMCQVSLSREMLDRGCPREKYHTLVCYDASGTRVKLQFFQPVEYIGHEG